MDADIATGIAADLADISTQATIELTDKDDHTLAYCRGDWTFQGVAELAKQTENLKPSSNKPVIIDGKAITGFDSAGSWALQRWIYRLKQIDIQAETIHFKAEYKKLNQRIEREVQVILTPAKAESSIKRSALYRIGKHAYERYSNIHDMFEFIGKFSMTIGRIFIGVNRFIVSTFVNAIDEVGWRALPIVGMMAFLIGIVLTYQMGLQLKPYGANIYIVNITGKTILREFGALITAIIASGRTASAFTAQIGLMKVKEELDALRCIGLSPIERLVVPKIVGTMVAMPLLVFWANIFGVLGSMVMAEDMLGISYRDFIIRFQDVIHVNDYMVGMYKAPVFALIVAAVGCFQGFRVTSTAESVGWQTTKSVVQSIFLIIVADAGFSVLFNWAGI